MNSHSAGWTVLAAGVVAGTLAAQERPLASVTITDVVADIARNIDIDASQLPLNVQVPMELAPEVCGLTPAALAREAADGVAQCKARTTTPALDQIVLRRVRGNGQR